MSSVSSAPGRAQGRVPLDQVITTEELARRPSRPPDIAAENRVLLALAETMAVAPHSVLQQLVDEARSLCRADSAGISLLESPEEGMAASFRWKATSGGLGPFAGNTMPRDFSPCGTVLDQSCTLLMSDPVRHFQYIDALPIPVREVLLVPFFRHGIAIGTVWVATHVDERKFDSEDARIVRSLSQFAAAAVQVIESSEAQARWHLEARAAAEAQLASMTALNSRLAEIDRERGEFLATLTHELRNMLGPMTNAVRIIAVSGERTPRDRAREMLDRQIRQMNRLVDDLLDTSRLSTGKLTLDLAEVDLTEIARNAVEAIRSRIEESGQSFHVDIPPTRLRMNGDEVRLTQILGNLLTNAAKYGVAGGDVSFSLQREGDRAIVRVRDTGVGIEASMLSRVFDLFVQVDQSLTRSEGGLGIGLALVKRLTAMHGGRAEARSDGPGKGSEFSISLPLLNAPD